MDLIIRNILAIKRSESRPKRRYREIRYYFMLDFFNDCNLSSKFSVQAFYKYKFMPKKLFHAYAFNKNIKTLNNFCHLLFSVSLRQEHC